MRLFLVTVRSKQNYAKDSFYNKIYDNEIPFQKHHFIVSHSQVLVFEIDVLATPIYLNNLHNTH